MRRTDEEFINEVYKRRKVYLKKQKQRNIILSVLLPVLLFGAFVGPAMLPASSADKSAPPLTTVTNAPSANQSTTYPPGAIIVTVEIEKENRTYSVEGSETFDFIKKNVRSMNSSQSSSAIHDEAEDSKRTDQSEKICTFSFSVCAQGLERYSYSLYENALYDELSGETIILAEEQVTGLKTLLNLN